MTNRGSWSSKPAGRVWTGKLWNAFSLFALYWLWDEQACLRQGRLVKRNSWPNFKSVFLWDWWYLLPCMDHRRKQLEESPYTLAKRFCLWFFLQIQGFPKGGSERHLPLSKYKASGQLLISVIVCIFCVVLFFHLLDVRQWYWWQPYPTIP